MIRRLIKGVIHHRQTENTCKCECALHVADVKTLPPQTWHLTVFRLYNCGWCFKIRPLISAWHGRLWHVFRIFDMNLIPAMLEGLYWAWPSVDRANVWVFRCKIHRTWTLPHNNYCWHATASHTTIHIIVHAFSTNLTRLLCRFVVLSTAVYMQIFGACTWIRMYDAVFQKNYCSAASVCGGSESRTCTRPWKRQQKAAIIESRPFRCPCFKVTKAEESITTHWHLSLGGDSSLDHERGDSETTCSHSLCSYNLRQLWCCKTEINHTRSSVEDRFHLWHW